MVLILKSYTVPVPYHDIKNSLNKRPLSGKSMSIFFTVKILRHFSITLQLHQVPFLCDTAHLSYRNYFKMCEYYK